MNKNRKQAGGNEGGVLPWLLLGCAVLVALFFVFRKPPQPKLEAPDLPPVAVATPAPATPMPATPPPAIAPATPAPPPVAVATPIPTPTPPPLELATVARTPALWPPQVALLQPVAFPVSFNGRVVGEAKAPAGTLLRLSRVQGQQVEVEYQTAKHLIPAASTDLMQRALVAFRNAGSVLPEPARPVMAPPVAVASATTPAPKLAIANPVKIGERIGVEVVRMKKSRTEGGDFDDKMERIELKVKLTNSDTKLSADKLQGEIFIFAESILDRSAVKLLAREKFDFSLPPRGAHEFATSEIVTTFDTTGVARFGHKYDGWILRIQDSAGILVVVKASSPTLLKNAEKIAALTAGGSYDRTTFKEKPGAR